MVVSGRARLDAATEGAYFLSRAALRRSRHLKPTSVDVSAVSDFDRKMVSHCKGATGWKKIKVGVGEDKGESDGVMNAAGCEVSMI